MAVWLHTLRVADVFDNDDLTFAQWRDTIVARLKAAPFYTDEYDVLGELVEELAETDDTHYFDLVWDAIYDWCDLKRVWIDTF